VVCQTFQCGLEITLFVVEKAGAVGDEILEVPELWPVYRGIVDFGDDSVPKSKPDPAGSCISSPHSIFSSMGPSGLDSRPSKSHRLVEFVGEAHPDSITLISYRNRLGSGG
jgi:hypothetical protein